MDQNELRKVDGADVLVIYMPVGRVTKLNETRDYVVESLRKGVLVLEHGTHMEVKRIPWLGMKDLAVAVVLTEEPACDNEPKEEKPVKEKTVPKSGTKVLREHSVAFLGAGGAEKKQIYQRLRAYRQESGLGCWDALVTAVRKSSVTADVLRQLYGGEISMSLAEWKAIDKGLDKLGFRAISEVETNAQNT